MKFSYLLPFVGLAQAVPAANPSRPSLFDNPTIPVGDPASLEDLPGLSHIRRATQPTLLNVTYCDVNVNGDGGFYTSWKAQNTRGQLYITQGIPSPGTKNGANLYEVYLQGGASSGAGSIRFTTNSNLLSLPLKIGDSNVDYAKVSMSSDGHIVAQVDYSNIDKPANSPLVFYSEPSIGNMVYGPPTRYVAFGISYLGVKVSDKGVADGVILLAGPYNNAPLYVARIVGICRNVPTPVVA